MRYGLAEGLALSEFLSTFTGAARRACNASDRPRDKDDLETLEGAQGGTSTQR